MKVICVFDGSRNPAKAATNEAREMSRKVSEMEAMRKSDFTHASTDETEIRTNNDEYKRLCSASASVREYLIALMKKELYVRKIPFLCSPFEADWQCISLEKQGLCHGTISVDSDMAIQGSKLLIMLNGKNKAWIIVQARIFPLLGNFYGLNSTPFTPRLLAIVATLLGCDYTPGICSEDEVKVWLPQFADNEDKTQSSLFIYRHTTITE